MPGHRPYSELKHKVDSRPDTAERIAVARAEAEREMRRFARNPLRRLAFDLRDRWEKRGLGR